MEFILVHDIYHQKKVLFFFKQLPFFFPFWQSATSTYSHHQKASLYSISCSINFESPLLDWCDFLNILIVFLNVSYH
jgi:hypothetical protein